MPPVETAVDDRPYGQFRLGPVRAVIQAEVQSGQLDRGTANDLLNKLDEIERHLATGQPDKAAEHIDKLRDKVDELATDDKITSVGQARILDSLDEFARGLPESGDGGDDD